MVVVVRDGVGAAGVGNNLCDKSYEMEKIYPGNTVSITQDVLLVIMLPLLRMYS